MASFGRQVRRGGPPPLSQCAPGEPSAPRGVTRSSCTNRAPTSPATAMGRADSPCDRPALLAAPAGRRPGARGRLVLAAGPRRRAHRARRWRTRATRPSGCSRTTASRTARTARTATTRGTWTRCRSPSTSPSGRASTPPWCSAPSCSTRSCRTPTARGGCSPTACCRRRSCSGTPGSSARSTGCGCRAVASSCSPPPTSSATAPARGARSRTGRRRPAASGTRWRTGASSRRCSPGSTGRRRSSGSGRSSARCGWRCGTWRPGTPSIRASSC